MLGSFPPLRALSSYCLELASSLADLGEVEFISFKKLYPEFLYPGGELKDDPTFPSVNHHRLKVKRRLTWYNPIMWIREGLFTKAELLHAQWWSLPLMLVYFFVCGGFKLRKRPVVFTVHNVLPHEDSWAFHKLSSLLFALGDHFIVHTTKNRKQLITWHGISPDKISLIPHGTLDFYARADMDREAIRRELGFGPHTKVILLFGALRAYKGIDTALKAFAEVLSQCPESRLLIAGKRWVEWEPYARLIEDLGIEADVKTCLQYIPSGEVFRFFAAADLVILPYDHFDSQSGVGSTAIAFRKPMIVTDVGGLPDLVGDPWSVAPPRDPAGLARAIVKCLKDPARLEAMSVHAAVVAEKLAWPVIARKTRAVYDKLRCEC